MGPTCHAARYTEEFGTPTYRLGDRLGADRWQRSADRASGRARWKIENEAVQYAGHGDEYSIFVLNLLAYFMHQIFELVDGLYQQVRAGFGARREFWGAVRATFRVGPGSDAPQPLSG